jgi:archaellum component FlaC
MTDNENAVEKMQFERKEDNEIFIKNRLIEVAKIISEGQDELNKINKKFKQIREEFNYLFRLYENNIVGKIK